jgi:hypothetical protein
VVADEAGDVRHVSRMEWTARSAPRTEARAYPRGITICSLVRRGRRSRASERFARVALPDAFPRADGVPHPHASRRVPRGPDPLLNKSLQPGRMCGATFRF